MDDYLSEREQWEFLKSWVRENGLYIVAGVFIGALALAGWQWWKAHAERQALAAAAQYEQVIQSFGRGERAQGLALVDELQREHPSSPYADQANLAAARVFVESGELDKAADRLRTVMQNTKDRELGLIARLRLARVELAQNKPDEALATLSIADAGAFAPHYQEVRGDVHLAKGDKAAALREYRAARSQASRAVVDTELLDLKINDLLTDETGQREPSAAASGE